MDSKTADKPHAVLVPYPAQGHITPMLKLGKLLYSKGFHITFVNTEYNHKRLIRSRGKDSVEGIDGFRFTTIPDGLPPVDVDITQDIPSLCESTSKNCLAPFRDLLKRLNEEAPKVSCIVSDGIMSFTLDVAQEMQIPNALLWTPSACGTMVYFHYRVLIQRGLAPLKDMSDLSNGYLDTPIDCIPGMNNLRLKDCPSFIRTLDIHDIMITFALRETSRTSKLGSAIILNTFDELEEEVLKEMSKLLPPIYSIGPLHLLANQLPENSPISSFNLNLWKEDPSCIEWLQTKEPGSVVYVNYGSITVMTHEQMIEFAWGLANSKVDFLWVVRPDLIRGENAILPEQFLTETKDRGFLAEWCDQEMILQHPSVGVFLTHCGWNSTLESICSGVPMICWPFFAEQQTNCRYVCAEWEVGMEMDNNVKRNEVEALIKEMMFGEKGKQMRKRIQKLKEKGTEATAHGGSSSVNLQKIVNEVLLRNCNV